MFKVKSLSPATLFAAAAVMFLAPSDSSAQASRTMVQIARAADEFRKQSIKAERDEMQREMNGPKLPKAEIERRARVRAETKEDLETLQSAYNELITMLSAGKPLSGRDVQPLASKINKHAHRLDANNIFPKAAAAGEPHNHPSQVTPLVKELCRSLYLLLTNDFIDKPDVLDLEAAAKARASLDEVIEVSAKIKSHDQR
jgi:hypothetical protein